MPNPNVIRLRHTREVAAGRTRTELDQNVILRMALTRCLEIVGEAAAKVTPATRAQLPSIPFGQIVSMRNRLIHAYFDVDLDIVWTTVSEDLPAIVPALDAALAGYEQ